VSARGGQLARCAELAEGEAAKQRDHEHGQDLAVGEGPDEAGGDDAHDEVHGVAAGQLGILPSVVLEVAGTVQDLLLAAALFGLGASVQVRALLQTSGRAIIAAMLSWGLIAALAFVGVHLI